MPKSVSVVGLGKLGSGLAAVIADAGFATVGVDVNQKLVDLINAGRTPDVEADLRDLMARHGGKGLVATTRHQEAIEKTDITFLIVNTPSDSEGHFSNAYLESALKSLSEALAQSPKPFHTFVISSTVTPGSVEKTLIPLIEDHSHRVLNEGFGVCYDPEFVALGAVVKGFQKPDVVVIGESSPKVGEAVAAIHRKICKNQPEIRRMTIINAELSKMALNVYMTLKISFGNALSNLCERVPGADCDVIANAIGQDKRIAPYYLRGGLSFGGPCFPRDTVALAAFSRQYGLEPTLIDAVDDVNEQQDQHLLDTTLAAVKKAGGGAVAVMGLSFKPGTAVITESPAIRLVQRLLEKSQPVVVYDPNAFEYAREVLGDRVTYAKSAAECLASAPVCVIANPEAEYRSVVESYRAVGRKVVVDCWRWLDPGKVPAGVEHIALGRGRLALPDSAGAGVRPNGNGKAHANGNGKANGNGHANGNGKSQMPRGNILGVGVGAVNMEMAVAKIEEWIQRREPNFVLAVPAHCIVECLRDENLRAIYNRAGMVTPDGMPIAWILRMMGHRHVDRVYGPDLMLAMCQRSMQKGYRHFLYGGWPPNVVEQLAEKLRAKFPGIQIVGTYAPPFRPLTPEEDEGVTAMINEAKPDIVWVGLGAAKEEFFSDSHVGKLTAPVLIGVGAAFDFHAGLKPQAPRWMMRAGLEWFFRVLTEPKRLGPRYLKDNPVFMWNILKQALGKTPPSIDPLTE